jgi:tRNA modification GTPase
MPYPLDDTIAAVASPPGGAARGILRLSGPGVLDCIGRVFQAAEACELSAIRRATVVAGLLRLAPPIARLDCDLYLWPDGRSYTGQPMAEIHTVGSPPLLEAALRALCRSGSRLAEPGQFTLRAFLAGRLDLTRAEAVLGAIDAADPAQFDVALAQLAGGLSRPLGRLRDELLELLAHVEAGFDFADEDLPFISQDELTRRLSAAAQTVGRIARQMATRRDAAEGVRIALVGWTNTGKSSLFNALVAGPGALVSDHPGTTRDYLTGELDLEGVRCLLIDTAGARTPAAGPDAELDRAAQTTSKHQSRAAHLRLFCIDSSRALNGWEREQLAAETSDRLLVLTKVDLRRATDFDGPAIATSSLSGEGIGALRAAVRDAALASSGFGGDVVAGTAARCRESLHLAAEGLRRALDIVDQTAGEELVAVEIRVALEELGKVVGAVYTDDMLDCVFSRFCVGK